MEVYLVYEMTYSNYDEDIIEELYIIGLYYNYESAIKKANERVAYGIENCDVVIDPDIDNKENPFETNRYIGMYRNGLENVEIYSINIEKLQLE